MDAAGAGEMTFPQFCVCAWNYCTYDAVGLATFAFNLYDKEGLGVISNNDMYQLIEESYDIQNRSKQGDWGADLVKNTPEYNMKLAKLKIAKAAGRDEQMDLKEWIRYSRTAPNLLKKAYVMQSVLQQDICGEKFWEQMTKKRRKKTKYHKEVIDWASIDEILHNMNRDPALSKILNIQAKPQNNGSRGRGNSNSSLSSSNSGTRKGKSKTSKYAVSKKATQKADEKKGRTMKRVRSQEEEEFTRALPSKRDTGKILKRKGSAESIQKMMRMKLAKQKVRRMRRAKTKLQSVGRITRVASNKK